MPAVYCYAYVDDCGGIAYDTTRRDSGPISDATAHLLSRALVNQSASESWCIKPSATSIVFLCVNLSSLVARSTVYV
jgi:hypothetical protein